MMSVMSIDLSCECRRIVHLVEAVGVSFNTIQTVYLRLTDAGANVSTIALRTQEQLDSREALIIIDARGQEITESPGTQGF